MRQREFGIAFLLIGLLPCVTTWGEGTPHGSARWTVVEGGIVRGDVDRREIALVFTADAHGEGTASILDTLGRHRICGSFFLTGSYLRQPAFQSCVRRMVAEGHYVGPHSHGHLLYCSWEDRQRSLVSEQEFKSDLMTNLTELHKLGVPRHESTYFIPPFEWYNAQHVQWARELGCVVITFTPGSGSHRDWIPESHSQFKASSEMLTEILAWECQDPTGLHGHLLLMHLGSERRDKMYRYLDCLIEALQQRGYEFVPVDRLFRVEGPQDRRES